MHIVIIGNGIAGVTTARHIRKKSNARISIISSESTYFYSRTALMYIYMGQMKLTHTQPYENDFWQKNQIALVFEHVEKVLTAQQMIQLSDGSTIKYDKLVIATGSKPRRLGVLGEDAKGVQGLYSLQDLEALENRTPHIKQAVVVGGGLIGIELAEMLLSRKISVTLLVREKGYWGNVLPLEESESVQRIIQQHGAMLRLETSIVQIFQDEKGNVKSIETNTGAIIDCQFVGVTVGVEPHIEFLKESEIETDRGVLVNEFLETNLSNIYAVGDCAQHRVAPKGRRPIEQVWYTGRMQGEVVADTILGNQRAYQPDQWFNSAKFFHLEYQTYGIVKPQLEADEESFFWQDLKTEKLVRFVFGKENNELRGVNLLGIRFRHEVCNKWLNEKRDMKYVLSHLEEVNFDPEFYQNHHTEILTKFKQTYPRFEIEIPKKSFLQKLASFVSIV